MNATLNDVHLFLNRLSPYSASGKPKSRQDIHMKSRRQLPSLPANRAFVVQLHAEAKVEEGEFRGRVEHIVSYQATHFDSLEELAAFLTKITLSLAVDEEET
jgi:hypothetical protein